MTEYRLQNKSKKFQDKWTDCDMKYINSNNKLIEHIEEWKPKFDHRWRLTK